MADATGGSASAPSARGSFGAVAEGYLRRIGARPPLVHCFSNYVAMDLMANAVLAAGASPAMVHSPDECADFTRISSALLVNMGTYSPAWAESMRKSIAAANDAGKPWVLDPVGCGATPARTAIITELARLRPTVIRGNASEVMALAKSVLGSLPAAGAAAAAAGGRGVDSTNTTVEALPAARALAGALGTVVAVTGSVDVVTDGGAATLLVHNGVELCTRITAAGCALTAVLAAFLAVRPVPAADDAGAPSPSRAVVEASAAALAVFGLAAQMGHHTVATAVGQGGHVGPASLRVALVDALHRLSSAATGQGGLAAATVASRATGRPLAALDLVWVDEEGTPVGEAELASRRVEGRWWV